jgi:hypothetical protein
VETAALWKPWKTHYVFPPLPQRLENSQIAREFPTVPTVTTAGSTKNEEIQNHLIAYQL